jgi:hypothetical protein
MIDDKISNRAIRQAHYKLATEVHDSYFFVHPTKKQG